MQMWQMVCPGNSRHVSGRYFLNPCHSIVKALHLQSKFNFGLFIAGYGKYPSPKTILHVASFLGNQFLIL